jgi:kinesin family member 21
METTIKVIARCRPLLGDEARGRRCLSITDDVVSVGDKQFQLERVYDESSTQQEIYDLSIRSLVEGCFDGFNATVFACESLSLSVYI